MKEINGISNNNNNNNNNNKKTRRKVDRILYPPCSYVTTPELSLK
jgi:hypothetical protein